MTGLLYKDFLLVRQYLRYYGLMLAVYTATALKGHMSPFILTGLSVFFALVVPTHTFDSDDQSHWTSYAAATPACRRGVADGKFCFTLLIWGASTLLALALAVLCSWGTGQVWDPLPAFSCAAFALAANALLVPISLLTGSLRRRQIAVSAAMLLFGSGLLLWFAAERGFLSLHALSSGLSAVSPGILMALCALLYAASWCIARRVYGRKEL